MSFEQMFGKPSCSERLTWEQTWPHQSFVQQLRHPHRRFHRHSLTQTNGQSLRHSRKRSHGTFTDSNSDTDRRMDTSSDKTFWQTSLQLFQLKSHTNANKVTNKQNTFSQVHTNGFAKINRSQTRALLIMYQCYTEKKICFFSDTNQKWNGF